MLPARERGRLAGAVYRARRHAYPAIDERIGPLPLFAGFTWDCWILPALLVVVWALSWRGSRRFRLWFALLAPAGAVAGLVLGVVTALSGPSEPGGGVAQWAADTDGGSRSADWVFASSLAALVVAVLLTVLTLVAEYLLLVRRT